MNFDTSKRKIKKIENEQTILNTLTEYQYIVNAQIDAFLKSQKKDDAFSVIRSKSTDWELMVQAGAVGTFRAPRKEDMVDESVLEVPVNSYETQYKTWRIDFGRINMNLLPMISVNILMKESTGEEENPDDVFAGDSDNIIFTYVTDNKFYEIADIAGMEDNEFIKNVTLHASIFIDGETEPILPKVPYSAKLLVDIINPTYYS